MFPNRIIVLAALCVFGCSSGAQKRSLYADPSDGSGRAASGSGCRSDSDCKQGRQCRIGVCSAPRPTAEDVARFERGEPSAAGIKRLTDSAACPRSDQIKETLRQARTEDGRKGLIGRVHETSGESDPLESYGTWIISLFRHSRVCEAGVPVQDLSAAVEGSKAWVSEREVDRALHDEDCAALVFVQSGDLWPYPQRLAVEVGRKDFSKAETTRLVWKDSLARVRKSCAKRLNRRETLALEAAQEKLDRIVGLDDPTLIELRTKLMDAMAQGKAQDVASYASAVSEREKTLDARHAAAFEQKLKTLQAENEKLQASAAAAARQQPATGSGQPGNGASSTPNVNDGIKTVQSGLQTVDMARKIFGF